MGLGGAERRGPGGVERRGLGGAGRRAGVSHGLQEDCVGRFGVILAMGIFLAALLGFAVRWLLSQRVREATTARKALTLAVLVSSLGILWLLAGGVQLLWLERRNQPVTVEDLRILERADALLKDESAWNRNDDRVCDDDKATGKWSLSCAVDVACIDVLGYYDHTRAALQEVRFVVEDLTGGRQFEGRLMGYNNLPGTRFEDIKRVLRLARERVAARLRGVSSAPSTPRHAPSAPAVD